MTVKTTKVSPADVEEEEEVCTQTARSIVELWLIYWLSFPLSAAHSIHYQCGSLKNWNMSLHPFSTHCAIPRCRTASCQPVRSTRDLYHPPGSQKHPPLPSSPILTPLFRQLITPSCFRCLGDDWLFSLVPEWPMFTSILVAWKSCKVDLPRESYGI